jgi:hypothetical protein
MRVAQKQRKTNAKPTPANPCALRVQQIIIRI